MTQDTLTQIAVRPFHIDVPEEEIDELRRRVQATRWPEKETVADQSQGVPLATIQELVRYWGTDYDFRRFEARLNAFNMPGTVPLDVSKALTSNVFGTGDSRPADLSADESRAYEQLSFLFTKGIGYALEMGLRPQTLYGLADSPIALAAWMLDHDARSYDDISQAPAAVSVFPRELYQAPRSWAEKAYPNLIYFNEVDVGNHFAGWQEPEIFTTEVRAAFRSLR
jgi:Epoxide hydrolase N terminus